MRQGEEARSCCVCSGQTMVLMKCSFSGQSMKLLSPRLSVTLSVLRHFFFFCQLFCSFLLLSSPETKSSTVSPSAGCSMQAGGSTAALQSVQSVRLLLCNCIKVDIRLTDSTSASWARVGKVGLLGAHGASLRLNSIHAVCATGILPSLCL